MGNAMAGQTAASGVQVIRPRDENEVRDAIAWAACEKTPLDIRGFGTKSSIGRIMQTGYTLDLSDLSGITLYEPEELVLSVGAGTPVQEIEQALAANGQELAFEPMDYGPLLRLSEQAEQAEKTLEKGTVGGLIGANLSGPRRIKAGAARDFILGMRAVTGRADIIKSGGRVVKNVTGYDLPRGLTGSWGTLAVASEITLKVLPAAEMVATLVLSGLDDGAATQAMALAMNSEMDVSAAAHLPESVRARFVEGHLPQGAATILRLEGFDISVKARLHRLQDLFMHIPHREVLDDALSRRLWREVRDVKCFADGTQRFVWRVSLAPSAGHQLVAALRLQTGVDAFYDWQGGLVWLRMEADHEAELIRRMVRDLGGGHATLVRADQATRQSVPVFEPQPPALAALAARLKHEFDPYGILNPGRMTAAS